MIMRTSAEPADSLGVVAVCLSPLCSSCAFLRSNDSHTAWNILWPSVLPNASFKTQTGPPISLSSLSKSDERHAGSSVAI